MKKKSKSKIAAPQLTDEEIKALKDEWATPPWFVAWLERLLKTKFILDPCADHWSAKCPRYYVKEDDGLAQDWSAYGPVFVNPPYSDPNPWIEKAIEEKTKITNGQHDTGNYVTAMLMLADTSTKWYHRAASHADLKIELRPRLRHLPPVGLKASSNRAGSVVFVFNLPSDVKFAILAVLRGVPSLVIDLQEEEGLLEGRGENKK